MTGERKLHICVTFSINCVTQTTVLPLIKDVSEKIARKLRKQDIRKVYEPHKPISSFLPNPCRKPRCLYHSMQRTIYKTNQHKDILES